MSFILCCGQHLCLITWRIPVRFPGMTHYKWIHTTVDWTSTRVPYQLGFGFVVSRSLRERNTIVKYWLHSFSYTHHHSIVSWSESVNFYQVYSTRDSECKSSFTGPMTYNHTKCVFRCVLEFLFLFKGFSELLTDIL